MDANNSGTRITATLRLHESGGFDNYNIFAQAGDIVGDQGFLEWNGAVEKTVSLPTAIRLGGSVILVEDKLEVGTDLIVPGNSVAGNYDKAIWALGGEFAPVEGLRFNAGISMGGNYGVNLPVGIVIRSGGGTWEAGLASRDAITFFTQNQPTLSLAFGFARFRF